jgi:hypothetical protein
MSASPPGGARRPRWRFGLIVLLIILILIVIILLFFFPRPRATVTLTPTSQNLSISPTENLATDNQSVPEDGTKTGIPTGPPKPGTNATGTLTFQNYTFDWVTIPQGTSISTNAGQQVVTDEAAYLPPDAPSWPGTASVPAHAANIGKDGNIPAMSFNDTPCCSSISTGITVTNASDFSGGTDNQTMKTVQQSDVDSIVKDLQSSLTQKAQKDIQKQLTPDEQLVTPVPQCSLTNVAANPGVGESATNFTVAVSLTCSDAAYNAKAARSQAEDQLKQTAAQRFPGFILVAGSITTKIDQVTPRPDGSVDVLVSASGKWKYLFTATQKANMAKHIARESTVAARAWLLTQTGVADASISIKGPILLDLLGWDTTLPDDVSAITING